jgi:hypothetical protein
MNVLLQDVFQQFMERRMYPEEETYLRELGCKRVSMELCLLLRRYQTDVTRYPRIQDLIRFHYRPCEPTCPYFISIEDALPILNYTFIEWGKLVECKKMMAMSLFHAVEGRYPTEFECGLFETNLSIEDQLRVFDQQSSASFANMLGNAFGGAFSGAFGAAINFNVDENGNGNGMDAEPIRNAGIDRLPDSYVLKRTLDANCCMCQEALQETNRVITLPCLHTFHTATKECIGIEKWFEQSEECPLCKKAI